MSEQKHTPLPWRVGPNNEIRAGGRFNVCPTVTAGGSAKGMLDEREVIRANAAFIVKAVNSHDALVAALEKARELARLIANSSVVAPATAADASRTLSIIDRALSAEEAL